MIALCPTPGAGLQQFLHGSIKAFALSSAWVQSAARHSFLSTLTALSICSLLHSATTLVFATNNTAFATRSILFCSLLVVVHNALRKKELPHLAQSCLGIHYPAGKPLFSQTFESI
ncbi:hypothetical protein [Paracnuella aquatica]|uniref:hypothetical protein n=1 Tax=Paracnuella aquatica TaxID=2268757 RepID=UPI000F510D06|nr:hypothetical protein [Paracnuella aquatica]RPD46746.1 hypothetical protein DRJ53_13505 [Paracnuella aquatica]